MTSYCICGICGRAIESCRHGPHDPCAVPAAACSTVRRRPRSRKKRSSRRTRSTRQRWRDMDKQRYARPIDDARRSSSASIPTRSINEKAKLMDGLRATTASASSTRPFSPPTATSRSIPSSKDVPYVLFLKGTSYFAQIKDITRDQQLSRDAIDTYTLLINNYPDSEYAKDARDKMAIAFDQLAGKEMSVGRYYLGNGQYAAAINRFRVVVEQLPDLDPYRGSAVPPDRSQSRARPDQRGTDGGGGARAQLPVEHLVQGGLRAAAEAGACAADQRGQPARWTLPAAADTRCCHFVLIRVKCA